VQHELLPRVAVDVGYFRRWYGNFTVTDNLAVGASDYSPFNVVVPNDPRLPLSGQTIRGFLDINPNVATLRTNNLVRFSKHYGEQYEYWQGVDIGTSVRLQGGLLIQGGLSTGKTVQDNCEVQAKVPEAGVVAQGGDTGFGLLTIGGPLGVPFCHQETPFLTQVKLLGAYTIPRIGVQVSATMQNAPGPPLQANYVVSNADVRGSLGRDLSGNNTTVTVPIVAPGSLQGDRLNQTDMRVGKIFRFTGNRRLTVNVDLFNVFNRSAVLLESSTYSAWRTPIQVMTARLLKFTVQASF
jgi:hypothetical protein